MKDERYEMKDMENKKKLNIDIRKIFNTCISRKWLFFKVWGITFVLACVWIFPQPRYYTAEVSIAPEGSSNEDVGSLASLASSFGVSLGNGSGDAIYPQLYPDLFSSTQFMVNLMDIRVKTLDGEVETDYFTYLKEHQKQNVLTAPFRWVGDQVKSLFKKEDHRIPGKDGQRFNPFQLSKKDTEVFSKAMDNIVCTYSRTTDVVTINVTDQDALVCALMADSVKAHLQEYITDYRTKKSRIDYEHYKTLTNEARQAYDKARIAYASYADSHQEVYLLSAKTKLDDLENEMQLKYNIYTAMNTRLEAAQAKVQENTPVFTTLANATVPVKPAGPKRMIFVAAMLFLATSGTVVHIFRKELKEWF